MSAAATAVVLVASRPSQLVAIAAGVAAVGMLAVAAASRRAGSPFVAGATALASIAIAVGAVALGVSAPTSFTDTVELVPGLVGILVLGMGLVPVRARWERRLVTAGTALVLIGVLTSGVVYGAGTMRIVGGVAATVVAWDAGEQAISLGEQVGRRATTWRGEVTHGAISAGVGVSAMGLVAGLSHVDTGGLPLLGLVLVAGSGLVLALTLTT